MVRKDEVSEASYEQFKATIDRGDFIEVGGVTFVTKKGERSILVRSWRLLAKTIKPLPEKWHGLKDKEERFRKRYLDLLMNQDVRKRFEMRSALIASIRNFLTRDGYFEVEPPSLQPIYGGGFARPFKTHHNALNLDVYLPISNEMYLKRLLTGGFEKVYSMTKVFRNEGVDQDHNPEFTMLEAQAAYTDYHYGMDLIERIFESVALEIKGTTQLPYQGKLINVGRPWKRMSMVESIKEIANVDVLKWKNVAEGKKAIVDFSVAAKQKEEMETMHSIGELIAFLFEIKVEETLIQPTIIYDYPVEVCPLAKRCAGDPRFAERFEYFVFGSELGNNYTELNDPVDLKKRFIEEKKREEAGFEEAHQFDQDYLDAVAYGMPPNCGIAIGIDRMVMLYTDAQSIREVILFPTMRPQTGDAQNI